MDLLETIKSMEMVCPVCKGCRSIYNPEWIEWNKKIDQIERNKKEMFIKEGEFCWAYFWDYVNSKIPEPDGPEDEECYECEGRGTVLTEEGEKIFYFLRKYIL